MREILTPGQQKRLLMAVDALRTAILKGERESVMYRAAEIMPQVVNQFGYIVEKTKKLPKLK